MSRKRSVVIACVGGIVLIAVGLGAVLFHYRAILEAVGLPRRPPSELVSMDAWVQQMSQPGFVPIYDLETEVHSFAIFRGEQRQVAFCVRYLTDYPPSTYSWSLTTQGDEPVPTDELPYFSDPWYRARGGSRGWIIKILDKYHGTAVLEYEDRRGSFQVELTIDAGGTVTPVSRSVEGVDQRK